MKVDATKEPAAEWVPLSALKQWAKNPRRNESNVARVVESIKRFGFAAPILARKADGEIIAGHTRYQAAKRLGIDKVPVRYLDLDPADAHLLALADNRLTDLGEWDDAKLLELLGDLRQQGDDAALVAGWSDAEIDGLLKEAGDAVLEHASAGDCSDGVEATDAPPAVPTADDVAPIDEAAQLREKWGTALGQLWEIRGKGGAHRLLCADSSDASAITRLFDGGAKAALLSTDPPYGVNFGTANHNPRAKEWAPIQGDDRKRDELRAWTASVWRTWIPFVALDSAFYVWSPSLSSGFEIHWSMRDADIHVQSQIVWVKNCLVLGQADYQWKHEVCWYGFFKGQHHRWFGGRAQTTTWDVARVKQADYLHPMQKPTELYAIPMRNHTREGEVCAEPFAGSGTQLVAAEQLGRVCYAMEIEPKFVAVALERLARLGLEPKLCLAPQS